MRRTAARPSVRGRLLLRAGERLTLRAVTYGPYAPGPQGEPFPAAAQVARDFAGIAALGANTLRTYSPPPQWLLDAAQAQGLLVMVGLPWTQHVCFADVPQGVARVAAEVEAGVAVCAGHPAVAAYVVGNEVPPDVVRWLGPARVEAVLSGLAKRVRRVDPGALVAYANFPSTEYLDPPDLDLLAFNVYLHDEAAFRRYVLRLLNLAGARPPTSADTRPGSPPPHRRRRSR